MKHETLAANAYVALAIRSHRSARDAPVRLSLIHSLQEMAKMAETNRSKGSYFSLPLSQITSVPYLRLMLVGEVVRE